MANKKPDFSAAGATYTEAIDASIDLFGSIQNGETPLEEVPAVTRANSRRLIAKENADKQTQSTLNKQELFGVIHYTSKEAADILGVSRQTLMEYVKTGKIKAVKIGGKWCYRQENINHFLRGEPQE